MSRRPASRHHAAPDAGALETELAFAVPAERAAAVELALRRAGARTVRIDSHYVDTDDRHLAAAGLSLRLRRTGGLWEQTLKAPAGPDPSIRHEHTVARPGAWDAGGPPVDPRLHEGSAPGQALADALAPHPADGSAEADAALAAPRPALAILAPSHASFVRRQQVTVASGGSAVEVAFDRGEIRAAERTLPVSEIELELKSGDRSALLALARETIAEHGVWRQVVSKSARGDCLRHGDECLPPAVKSRPPVLHRAMDAHRRLQTIVEAILVPMVANSGALASGDRRDEVIHQLRVAIRRFRTVSRELCWMSPRFDLYWASPLVHAFRLLGVWRDRETVAAALAGRLREAGSPAPVLQPAAAKVPDPVALVRTTRFQLALLDVMAFASSTDDPPPAVSIEAAEKRIARRLDKLVAEVGKAAKTFAGLDEPGRHRVRKRLKRLRYLAEAIGPLHKRARVTRFLDRLEPAQDALGEHVDLVVGLELATASAERGDAASWFNVGWIRAAMPASVERCSEALASASRAPPFWHG